VKGKDFLSVCDLGEEDLTSFVRRALAMKTEGPSNVLAGKTLALLFEKPSLRTRVSFEMAMRRLGGDVVYLSPPEVGLGARESVADVARVLGRYVDAISARTFSHRTVEELAGYSGVPVINALSDHEHPCQALADFLTIYEKKGELKGLSLAYVGDGNNVANSLLLAAAMAGTNIRIASPADYSVSDGVLSRARELAAGSGAEILLTDDPRRAVAGADVVYTDVWTSMGQEAETERRRRAFVGYCIDREMMALARPDAIFMHDLPAHRGEEVTDDVMDGSQSVVFDQAENRMHSLRPLMASMLGTA
jgi:ornithine carbamoyltransferase